MTGMYIWGLQVSAAGIGRAFGIHAYVDLMVPQICKSAKVQLYSSTGRRIALLHFCTFALLHGDFTGRIRGCNSEKWTARTIQ